MIEDKKLKEAERNITYYLEQGLLTKITNNRPEILETYKRNYKESFNVSRKINEQDLSSLWVVVTSYYSMFYIANAVLYKEGYKVGSKTPHKITSDALLVIIRNKLKKNLLKEFDDAKTEAMEIIGRQADEIISDFEKEKNKRSEFQYETTEEIKKAKAQTSIDRARRFIYEMEKLLLN